MTATLSALGTDSGPGPAGASPQETSRHGVTWRGALAGLVGIAILTVTAVVTIFAPLIAPYGSNDQNLLGILKAPSAAHPFGTDELGRDVLTRVIYGGREALLITVLATAAGVLLGVGLGLWTALSQRWTDNVVGRLADVQLALPSILLALVVLSFSGSNPVSLVVVLALGVWVLVFRVVRANARSVAAQPFVEAARLAGADTWQVVRRHVLPATLPLVAVATALSFSTVLALLAEARQIIAAHDEALRRLALVEAPEFVIGTTDHAADHLLPPVVSALGESFPDLQVKFRFDRTTPLNDALDRGSIDLAVYITEASSQPGKLVGSLRLVWCSAAGWTPPPPDQPWPLIAIEEPCAIRGRALAVLGQHGIRVKVVGDAAYLAGVLNAARAGLGVTLLALAGPPPEGLVERHDLPAAPPVSLTARARPGADPVVTRIAFRALRSTLALPQSS